jgi:hypothetical protein
VSLAGADDDDVGDDDDVVFVDDGYDGYGDDRSGKLSFFSHSLFFTLSFSLSYPFSLSPTAQVAQSAYVNLHLTHVHPYFNPNPT